MLAFDKADEYRNPVMILGDGILGQMMEPFYQTPYIKPGLPEKTWVLTGCGGRTPNVIKSGEGSCTNTRGFQCNQVPLYGRRPA